MSIFKKALIGFAIILLIPTGMLVWFFASGGLSGGCDMHEIIRRKSPDEKYEVMVYTKSCGATTSAATLVALKMDENAFEDVFVLDADGGVDATWLDKDQLIIYLSREVVGADVFRKEMHWHAVSIKYK